MATKDRDLDELLNFETAGAAFGERVEALARDLRNMAESADGCLRDDVAKKHLEKIRELATELGSIGLAAKYKMTENRQNTLKEIDDYNNL